MHPLHDAVSALIRTVSAEIILPRFRTLAAHEIIEKAPGDLVTIADRESEVSLARGLAQLDPGARIVGEEASAEDPALLDRLGHGRAWLIDPIDGTANFAEGITPFGVMIGLIEDGEPIAGWIYDPVADRMCHGSHGSGAFIDGARVSAAGSGAPLPIVTLPTHFIPADQAAGLAARADGRLTLARSPRCAAEQYARLVLGQDDVAVYERSHPWDHAAGTVFLREAGGLVSRRDGARYVIGEGQGGLIAAVSQPKWDVVAETLFGPSEDAPRA